jgi:hypothetical protein
MKSYNNQWLTRIQRGICNPKTSLAVSSNIERIEGNCRKLSKEAKPHPKYTKSGESRFSHLKLREPRYIHSGV